MRDSILKNVILTLLFIFIINCEKNICSSEEREIADKFEIHLQHHFNDTYVYLKIDDKNIFSGKLNTDYIINLAAVITPQIENGYHTIQAYIESNTADTSFTLRDSLIIGITYNESPNNIAFCFYEPPNFPRYD